jgi:hypothetical protein
MTDEHDCWVRDRAEFACSELDRALEQVKLDTDQMAHFWQHLTEQSTLRLIRLRPEMVTRVDGPAPD